MKRGGLAQRFTVDGSEELESQLLELCHRVAEAVLEVVSAQRLEALVLAGGYGRGQGGVLFTPAGDRPYNDLEFYVFLRHTSVFESGHYAAKLNDLGERLSGGAGLHVEFKLDSLRAFRRRPISMFSYDLVAAHRIFFGGADVFDGCEHHLQAHRLPLSEATRLLFNRCTGLLLARKLLRQPSLTETEADFVGRNLAKAQLALGDALLTAAGRYHWDCRERHRRLMNPSLTASLEQNAGGSARPSERASSLSAVQAPVERLDSEVAADLANIQAHHYAGLEFKLHPKRFAKPIADFQQEHREISQLAQRLWLWLERRRLREDFDSPCGYAVSRLNKCPESPAWKNYLLNLRTLGAGAMLQGASLRYPRNRLFNSLPLLLWNGELAKEPELLRFIQGQLHTRANDWHDLVAAYEGIWKAYG